MKKLVIVLAAVAALFAVSFSAIAEEYDALRTIFLGLSFETTAADIEAAIAEYNLEYTSRDYNGSPKHTCYKLGYEEGVVLQKYADSGDYLTIDFNRKDGTFMCAVYFDNEAFVEAILFNYGHYFELHEKEPGGPNSGYYSLAPGKEYERCESAGEAIRLIDEKGEAGAQ